MFQCYIDKNFHNGSMALIDTMNDICTDYLAQGYILTVRQLYYQLVARDVVPNTMRSYKRVASIVNDAKLAGLMDWDAIEDRTRGFEERSRWESGSSILRGCANQFHMDLWEGQDRRVFVIVEKEALVGVLNRTCYKYDTPLLAARGYPSGSVLRDFVLNKVTGECPQGALVLHLGDHDPSGIDMTRDLQDRINLFADAEMETVEVKRIALNMDQVREVNPPENPAKVTDSRYASYRKRYGASSWELDALSPTYLNKLLTKHIEYEIDQDMWDERKTKIAHVRNELTKVADDFEKKEI